MTDEEIQEDVILEDENDDSLNVDEVVEDVETDTDRYNRGRRGG